MPILRVRRCQKVALRLSGSYGFLANFLLILGRQVFPHDVFKAGEKIK